VFSKIARNIFLRRPVCIGKQHQEYPDKSSRLMIASENGRNKDEIKCVIEIHTRLESSSDSAGAGRNLERPGNTDKTSSLPYTRRTKRHTFTWWFTGKTKPKDGISRREALDSMKILVVKAVSDVQQDGNQ
jgi:hypothetical protein